MKITIYTLYLNANIIRQATNVKQTSVYIYEAGQFYLSGECISRTNSSENYYESKKRQKKDDNKNIEQISLVLVVI